MKNEDETNEKKNARDNLTHAGEFTKIKNTAIVYVLRGWFGSLIRPENATQIVYAELQARAKAAQDKLSALLSDTNEDERINALTDKTVEGSHYKAKSMNTNLTPVGPAPQPNPLPTPPFPIRPTPSPGPAKPGTPGKPWPS